MKRFFGTLMCLLMLASWLPVSVSAVYTTIAKVELEDLDIPLAGATPDTSVTICTAGYTIYSLEWYDVTADRYLNAGEKFIESHVYRVVIWLQAKDDFEFKYTNSYTPDVVALVNEKTAYVNKAYEYNAWAMVEVCYTFQAAPSKWIRSVNIQLEGLVKDGNVLCASEDGHIPFTIQSASEDISVYPQLNPVRYHPDGFRWSDLASGAVKSNGEHFKGGCEYYVHIAIKLNSGGFADNLEVTINGKLATIKTKGQSYAEVGVEVTCFGGIVANDIRPVVILPKDGNYPDYGVTYAYPQCEHIDYAAVDGWYDVETGQRLTSQDTFVGGKQYRVVIYCMAAYPYKFTRDANDKMQYSPQITGWDVDSYTFGYDDYRGRELIYLTKTFTAETRDHICVAGPWQCDESGHENYCTICRLPLAGGAHWSNGEATCSQGKLCEVCGYELTKPTENHTPDTGTWTACGNLYHAHLCKLCGAHCDPQDHVPGPEATETTPQKCTVCDYVIAPPKNHTHNIIAVAENSPTCTRTGNIAYYMCEGCRQVFADKDGKKLLTDSVLLPATGHVAEEAWQQDSQNHWRCCAVCREILPETQALHQGDPCAICGAKDGETTEMLPQTTTPEDATIPTDMAQSVKTENGEEETGNSWLLPVLIGGLGFAAAVTVTTIVLKKKK